MATDKHGEELNIGDYVGWYHDVYGRSATFAAYGTINDFKTAAGYKPGASITIDHEATPRFKEFYPKRNKTSIGLNKLVKRPKI